MIKNAKQIVITEDNKIIDVSEVREKSLVQVLQHGNTIGFVTMSNGVYLINIGLTRVLGGCKDLKELIRKYPQYTFYVIGD